MSQSQRIKQTSHHHQQFKNLIEIQRPKKVPQTHYVIGSKVSGHNDRLDISFKNQYIDTIDMLSSCYFQSMY